MIHQWFSWVYTLFSDHPLRRQHRYHRSGLGHPNHSSTINFNGGMKSPKGLDLTASWIQTWRMNQTWSKYLSDVWLALLCHLLQTWVVKKSLISLWWKWHIFSKHQWWYWHETAKHHLKHNQTSPWWRHARTVSSLQPFLGSPATVLQSKLFTADLREVNVQQCFTSTNNAWHGQRWTQFCVHMFQQTSKSYQIQ